MKATGIVRKVDDLGRLVIPMETRRTLGINVGDPMEIYVDGQSIILKKYDSVGSVEQLLERMEAELRLKADLISPEKLRGLIAKAQEMREILNEP